MNKKEILRKWLGSQKEDYLRKNILIPLFENMGYKGVFDNHGNGEIGKDILMWKQESLSERDNYAVVVKAKTITGNVNGNSSAGEVCTQIRQSFGSEFIDPVDGSEQRIHRCIVVTSGEIKRDAINSINAELTALRLGIVTRLISCHTLVDLILQYLPNISLVGLIEQTCRDLCKAASAARLLVDSTKDITKFQIVADPDIDKSHLQGSMRFKFTNDDAGRAVKKALDEIYITGKPVKIDSQFINGIDIPPFISTFIPDSYKPSSIVVAPVINDGKEIYTSIIIEGEDVYELNCIVFQKCKYDDEELVFSNENQNIPIKLSLIFNFKKNTIHLSYDLKENYDDMDVCCRYKYESFVYALNYGDRAKVINIENGLCIASITITKTNSINNEKIWIEVLRMCSEIQKKINKLVLLPKRDITKEDVKFIFDVYTKLIIRKIPLKKGIIKIPIDEKTKDIILKTKDGGDPFKFDLSNPEVIDFFGTEIQLVDSLIVIPAYIYKESDSIEERKNGDGIEYILTVNFDETMNVMYVYP